MLGVLLLACTVLYAVPRTALLGAILLTGYLGGSIAIHLRAGSPLFSHVLFGAYVGLALWAGLLARDRPARAQVFACRQAGVDEGRSSLRSNAGRGSSTRITPGDP